MQRHENTGSKDESVIIVLALYDLVAILADAGGEMIRRQSVSAGDLHGRLRAWSHQITPQARSFERGGEVYDMIEGKRFLEEGLLKMGRLDLILEKATSPPPFFAQERP